MLLNLGAGQDGSAKVADFTHGWVEIVVLVCFPGGALCRALAQAAVMLQPQTNTHGECNKVQK